jgi:dienelactone hydrolase
MFLGLLAIFFAGALRLGSYGPEASRQSITIPALPGGDSVGQPGFPVPALRFAPTSQSVNAIAVITHGSPGNKEMMTAIGAELAKAGVTAYSYDLPGFGQSSEPASLYDENELQALDEVVRYAEAHPPVPGETPRLILIGYSYGAAVTGDYASFYEGELPELAAVVVISGDDDGYDSPDATYLPNLLALVGQFDLPGLASDWSQRVASVCEAPAAAIVECDPSTSLARSARRFVQLGLQDHVTMPTAGATQDEILHWLARTVDPHIAVSRNDASVRWVALLVAFAAATLALGPGLTLGATALRLRSRAQAAPGPTVMTWPWLLAGCTCMLPALGLGLVTFLRWPRGAALLHQLGTEAILPGVAAFGLAWLALLIALPAVRRRLAWPARTQVFAQIALALGLLLLLYLTLGQLSSYTWVSFALPPDRLWRAVILSLGFLPLTLAAQLLVGAYTDRRPWQGALFQASTLLVLPVALALITYQQLQTFGLMGILLPVICLVVVTLVALDVWARRQVARPTITLALLGALVVGGALAATFPIYR